MAVTLNEIIDTTVFQDIDSINSPEKTALFESGAVVKNPLLDEIASRPGFVSDLPFWNDLDETDVPNISTDNPAQAAAPGLITQGHQMSRTAKLNKSWAVTDLASEVAMGPKAMDRIKDRTEKYWMRQWQRRLIATANGVLLNNVNVDGSDMVIDVAGATNGDVNANTVFNRMNFTSAAFTMGDAVDGIQAIAVHSVVYKRMVDDGDIIMIRPQEGSLEVPTFLGKRVVVDDSMPVVPAGGAGAGDDAPRFTSVLFGAGAFGYGDGTPQVPVAVDRNEDAGNGGGVETLYTRKTWILHPFGYQAILANPGLPAAYSIAELSDAGTWSRVVARKNVPLAFLVTNG